MTGNIRPPSGILTTARWVSLVNYSSFRFEKGKAPRPSRNQPSRMCCQSHVICNRVSSRSAIISRRSCDFASFPDRYSAFLLRERSETFQTYKLYFVSRHFCSDARSRSISTWSTARDEIFMFLWEIRNGFRNNVLFRPWMLIGYFFIQGKAGE